LKPEVTIDFEHPERNEEISPFAEMGILFKGKRTNFFHGLIPVKEPCDLLKGQLTVTTSKKFMLPVPHIPTNLGSADELKETLEKEFCRLPTKFKDKYGCMEEDADSIISSCITNVAAFINRISKEPSLGLTSRVFSLPNDMAFDLNSDFGGPAGDDGISVKLFFILKIFTWNTKSGFETYQGYARFFIKLKSSVEKQVSVETKHETAQDDELDEAAEG
jgi:hypothetical protein